MRMGKQTDLIVFKADDSEWVTQVCPLDPEGSELIMPTALHYA
jgi:hypothetical protein